MTPRRVGAQAGQALVEALVVCVLFVLLGQAFAWLWRTHALGISAQHASAHAAFLLTRTLGAGDGASASLANSENETLSWLAQQASVSVGSNAYRASLNVDTDYHLAPSGLSSAAVQAALLASQWQANDTQVYRATVGLAIPASGVTHRQRALPAPFRFARSVAILANAGHASSDANVQFRLGQSSHGWATAASASYALARRIHASVAGVDSAWGRPSVSSEWLSHWQSVAPHAGQQPVFASPGGQP